MKKKSGTLIIVSAGGVALVSAITALYTGSKGSLDTSKTALLIFGVSFVLMLGGFLIERFGTVE